MVAASEGAAFLFNLVVGFAIGVCTCVTLCCAQRGSSLEIIVAADQLRSLPGFRVQELLGTVELAGNELMSGPQLQWAVVRLFELNCCAIPLTAAGSGGILAVPARAVAGLDLGTQEGDVDVPLTGGPSVRSCTSFRFLRLLPTSRAGWKLFPKFQGNPSDSRQMDGYHTFRRWSKLLHGARDAAEPRKAVHCPLLAPRTQS